MPRTKPGSSGRLPPPPVVNEVGTIVREDICDFVVTGLEDEDFCGVGGGGPFCFCGDAGKEEGSLRGVMLSRVGDGLIDVMTGRSGSIDSTEGAALGDPVGGLGLTSGNAVGGTTGAVGGTTGAALFDGGWADGTTSWIGLLKGGPVEGGVILPMGELKGGVSRGAAVSGGPCVAAEAGLLPIGSSFQAPVPYEPKPPFADVPRGCCSFTSTKTAPPSPRAIRTSSSM